mgnify:CR=1 FL=1
MTLNKINKFSQTQDAANFAKGIKARVEGAALFAPQHAFKASSPRFSVPAVA